MLNYFNDLTAGFSDRSEMVDQFVIVEIDL